jgi:uncharacterized SAM-binding protein YcdF (DUF218 family)
VTYIQPFTLLFLSLFAAGLYGLRRNWRTGAWRLAFCGLLGMFTLSWLPASAILGLPLTNRYARRMPAKDDSEVIVVLSGAVEQPTGERHYSLLARDTYIRVQHAAWLFHNWKPLPILATGGPGLRGGEAVSSVMRRALEQEGVPPSKIWTEEKSRSTYENALYSARLLHGSGIRRIALVVEADSMLRAEMCFRKQGFDVTPVPCMFWDLSFNSDTLVPGWQGIDRQELLLHEGIGLIWYWLRGWV